MVMEVVRYTMAEPPLSISEDAPFCDYRDASMNKSAARDTSTSPRDTLEELRQSHTSILNVTTDGEEESEDEEGVSVGELLFADLIQPPRLEADGALPKPAAVTACCAATPADRPRKSLLRDLSTSFDIVTESFTDTLCGASTSTGDLGEAATPCGNFTKYCARDRTLRHQMELDVLALLGCNDEPTEDELAAWTSPGPLCGTFGFYSRSALKAHAASRQEAVRARVSRIHRIKERSKAKNAMDLKRTKSIDNSMLVTVSSTDVSTETYFPALGSYLGFEQDAVAPIEPVVDDDGYDSDPGDFSFETAQPLPDFYDPLDVSAITQELEDEQTDCEIYEAVQESLNYTWNLQWHPTPENLVSLGVSPEQNKPAQAVNMWFERGNILNLGHTIIEPQLMFRACDASLSKPLQLRLLNVCRILTMDEVDRTKFPLAKSSHSIIVRMVRGEDYLFEASSPVERNYILQRWKLVVARLATLAVFEDIPSMTTEFFAYTP